MWFPICFSHHVHSSNLVKLLPSSLPLLTKKQWRDWGQLSATCLPRQSRPSYKCIASGNLGVRAAEPFIIRISLPHNYLHYPRERRTPLSLPASHLDSNWDLKTLETWVGGSVHYFWWMLPWVMRPADPQRTCAQLSIEEVSFFFLFLSMDLLFASAN